MITDYIQQIRTYFRNKTLNAIGAERTLYELMEDADVETAIAMMQNRDLDVDAAIKEYNPQTHDVMNRPNKYRKNDAPYISEKLPRARQRYINEVELFFLLGKPVKWSKKAGSDEAFKLFSDFLANQRFDSNMRKAKRLAGAETECAKLYHITRNDDTRQVKTVVLARSTGYQLRPLFDQYGNMTAFAYGYKLKENGKSVQHWDIQTPDLLFFCSRGNIGWEVKSLPNPTGKINCVYYQQPKAWDGAEPRIRREEMLDSKVGDTNNYFADPIAAATADVIDSLADRSKPGNLIQLTGSNSKFEYINPPMSSETRDAEKRDLNTSILFDTFTPDFSWESLKGMGTLSGDAIYNSMIMGFIKRDNRMEIYAEMLDREKNIIKEVLKFMNPGREQEIDELEVSFEFQMPFAEDKQRDWTAISSLYTAGLLSLEKAVDMLALTDAPQEEIERIKASKPTEANPTNTPTEERETPGI